MVKQYSLLAALSLRRADHCMPRRKISLQSGFYRNPEENFIKSWRFRTQSLQNSVQYQQRDVRPFDTKA
jgi:hypothetical protein